jgi:hypothetical protein
MAEQLKNILSFSLAAGASAVLPHGLKTSLDTPVVPDIVFVPSEELAVTADDTAVTLTNNSGGPIAGNLLVEWWHTIERGFGDVAITKLTPQPYIVVSPEGSNQPPWPPFATSTTIIYARPTGNDTTGDGKSPATAYATFSRAIRDVPQMIPPGNDYIVDITGVTELLPPGYALPAIKSSGYYNVTVNDLDTRVFRAALGIRAQYVPFSGVPVADRTIALGEIVSVVSDPDTGQIVITTTKAWVPGALRGAIIQTGSSPKRTAMVYENTANALILANTSTNAVWFAPTAPFQLLEQSATLTAQDDGINYTGVSFRNIDSLFVDGVRFRNADPSPYSYSVNIVGCPTPIFGACDIEGIYIGPLTQYTYLASTMLRNKIIESEGQTSLYFAGSVLQDMPTMYTYDVEFIQLAGCGVRNCAAIGPRPATIFTPAFTTVGTGSATKIAVTNTQIDGSVADTDYGTPGYGILNNALAASIANCRISGCAADAIYSTAGSSAIVQHVVGLGNGGVGVLADMGSQVSVDAATTVSGAGGACKAGSLLAAAFPAAGFAQYDLPPDAASLDVATGARIFGV